jgi:hypothetical protein
MLECLAAANPAPTLKELGPGLLLPDAAEAAALPPRCVWSSVISRGRAGGQNSTHNDVHMHRSILLSTISLFCVIPTLTRAHTACDRTLAWRTRLLANTARFSGPALLPYLSASGGSSNSSSIPVLLALTLEHEEKDVRKAGGKLLRRCLQVRPSVLLFCFAFVCCCDLMANGLDRWTYG